MNITRVIAATMLAFMLVGCGGAITVRQGREVYFSGLQSERTKMAKQRADRARKETQRLERALKDMDQEEKSYEDLLKQQAKQRALREEITRRYYERTR